MATANLASKVTPLPLNLDTLPVNISFFEDVDQQPQSLVTSWGHVSSTLASPSEHASKADCHLLNLAVFGDTPNKNGNLRHVGNVTRHHGLMADYDGETVSFDEAVARLKAASIEAVVYTSPSHTPEKPRWRLVVPFSKPHRPSEYANYADLLNGALGGVLGAESWDTSRCYYYGRVPGTAYRCERVSTGSCIDDGYAEMMIEPIGKPGGPSKTPLPQTAFDDYVRKQRVSGATEETMQDLASALDWLSAHTNRASDRDAWVSTGYALASLKPTAFAEPAFELWDKFSQTCPAKYNVEDMRGRWDGFSPERISYRSLFAWAQLAGWVNPRKGKAPADASTRRGLHFEMFNAIEPDLTSVALVSDYLEQGAMSVIYGESNSGKTFFAMDLALHVALGRDWRGRRVQQGAVVYVAAEAGKGARKRLTAFRKHHALEDTSVPFALVPCPVDLLDPKADTQPLIDLIGAVSEQAGQAVALVVIDTLARALAASGATLVSSAISRTRTPKSTRKMGVRGLIGRMRMVEPARAITYRERQVT